MTYSNIKKDKEQPNKSNLLKKTSIIGILLIIILSSGSNIYHQVTILKEAKLRNEQADKKIREIEQENEWLEKNIAQATNSALMERKYREYLGIGTSKDVWLLLPPEDTTKRMGKDFNMVENKPIIVQWWDLFTN